jgi:hypothetical protein
LPVEPALDARRRNGLVVARVEHHERNLRRVAGEMRAVTPVLILGPGDTVKSSTSEHSDPRIVQVDKEMREVAEETGDAFWDFRDAIGGDASIIGFTKRGLTGEDHIHFGPEGSALMGNRLLCRMFDDLNAHLEKHPEAGCTTAK